MLASEGAELTFGMLDPQVIAQANCEEILPDQALRNPRSGRDPRDHLGLLVSPVQEGELNELFVKRKSSQA